ncbi:hypothetical protein LINPERHAP2_LOCUS23498 [Linum perenne]
MDMSSAAMQKISVVDHINGFQYTPERSTEEDNFVIDMEDLSHNRESYPSSRITKVPCFLWLIEWNVSGFCKWSWAGL